MSYAGGEPDNPSIYLATITMVSGPSQALLYLSPPQPPGAGQAGIPIVRLGQRGPERLRDMPKVTQKTVAEQGHDPKASASALTSLRNCPMVLLRGLQVRFSALGEAGGQTDGQNNLSGWAG